VRVGRRRSRGRRDGGDGPWSAADALAADADRGARDGSVSALLPAVAYALILVLRSADGWPL